MSATVKYNGSTIASVEDGGSVTLDTQGKYMSGNVTVEAADVPQGSAGTPVATKGAVSNHAVSVTPSVTNTTGYITGGTLSGTPATVQASELVSGTKQISISASGTITEDVTNYASVEVAVPQGSAGTPTAVKGSVSNHSITVTPSVTNTTGFITGGTKSGTAATVSASELVSGTLSITENGAGIDVTNYANVDVNVSGGGGGGSKSVTITASLDRLVWVDANGTAHYDTNSTAASDLVNPISRVCLSGSLICLFYTVLEPGTSLSVSNATQIASLDHGSRANQSRYCRIYQVD